MEFLSPVALGLIALVAIGPAPAQAQCSPHWERFPGGDLNGSVSTLLSDDRFPNSPVLYVGGDFTGAGDISASRIARWDGSVWSALGNGMNGSVEALTIFDDDDSGPNPPALYAGGPFSTAGGVSAVGIAKWDGSSWSALASGMGGSNPSVSALTVFDDDGAGPNRPALYAGGYFTAAGGVGAMRIAKWDGSSWSALSTGMGGSFTGVRTLSVYDDDGSGPNPPILNAGGNFTTAGGISATGIAKWDGSSWSAVGGGVDYDVSALSVFDDDGAGPNPPSLHAGGDFTMAGGVVANSIAKWDGSSWSALGSGIAGSSHFVFAMFVFDDDGTGPNPSALYAGGDFTTAGGVTAENIAKWNGLSWSAVGGGVRGVRALTVHDDDGPGPDPPALYAGGGFITAGGAVNHVATWDGSSWSALDSGKYSGIENSVSALTVFDSDGTGPNPAMLCAAGTFIAAGGVGANYIAQWDGSSWSALGSGMNNWVETLTIFDDDGPGPRRPALYAGGQFTTAGGVSALGIARWDGSSWRSLGAGIDGPVFALSVFDDDGPGPSGTALFAAGVFTTAGGISANNIAKWNGSSWVALGSGLGGGFSVDALTEYDEDGTGPNPPRLFAGGTFTSAGGVSATGIAKWDGSSWSAVGGGVDYGVWALTVFDDDGAGPNSPALYGGGVFTTAGGVAANSIAKWDGSSWSGLGLGTSGYVFALTVFDDDGSGPNSPALFAGGNFTDMGGLSSDHIATWNGALWSPLNGGVDGNVVDLLVFDDDAGGSNPAAMYAVGGFGLVEGLPSARIARWVGCGSSIASFCFGDGTSGACPCGNGGAVGHGCENAAGTGGAILRAAGNPALTGDTLVLTSSKERTNALSVFLQGTAAMTPVVFGDGLLCVGGSPVRLYTKNAASGRVIAPAGSEPSITSRSAARGDPLHPGAGRHYQVYYRDPSPGFCPPPLGNTWNISNGVSVVWTP